MNREREGEREEGEGGERRGKNISSTVNKKRIKERERNNKGRKTIKRGVLDDEKNRGREERENEGREKGNNGYQKTP